MPSGAGFIAADAEFAPAKLNLHLHVVGRRDDGYHLLDSLVVFAGVGDLLEVSPSNELSLAVTGPFAGGLQTEPDNLVLRAARALASHAGIEATGSLRLCKRLPVASGIGGGSADAAAALRLLRRHWGVAMAEGQLVALAQRLGADVPVCLASCPAMMSGIGEILAPAPRLPNFGIVLVNPGAAVSTPSVFQARTGGFAQPAQFPAIGWPDARSLAASLRTTRNDLETPARLLAASVADALDWLAATPGCMLSRMSGSGATCFGLFETPMAAERAAMAGSVGGWWAWGGGLALWPMTQDA